MPQENITATLVKPASNARNFSREKETTRTLTMVCAETLTDGGIHLSAPIDVRWYMARHRDGASPVYCSVWIYSGDHSSGRGKASGCGYDKESAALEYALMSAGFRFSRSFGGAGDRAIEDAIHAVADCMQLPKTRILV